MHCPRCGAANADGATVCVACGSAINPMPAVAGQPGAVGGWTPPAPPMTRPTGVTILAVLYFIGAGVLALAGLAMFAVGGMAGAMGGLGVMFGALGAFLGIVMLLFAALAGVAGWGLWTGKGWAWMLALVLTALNAVSNLFGFAGGDTTSIVSSVIGLAIAGFIIWYLLQPGVKKWFGKA